MASMKASIALIAENWVRIKGSDQTEIIGPEFHLV